MYRYKYFVSYIAQLIFAVFLTAAVETFLIELSNTAVTPSPTAPLSTDASVYESTAMLPTNTFDPVDPTRQDGALICEEPDGEITPPLE